MGWPTNKPDSTKFDNDNDSIRNSRPELKTMSDAVNDIVDFIDTTAKADNYTLSYNAAADKLEFTSVGASALESNTIEIGDTANDPVQILANTGATNKGIQLFSRYGGSPGASLSIFYSSMTLSAQINIINDCSLLRIPRISTTTRTNYAAYADAGDIIFNTTTNKFQGYDGTSWVDFH